MRGDGASRRSGNIAWIVAMTPKTFTSKTFLTSFIETTSGFVLKRGHELPRVLRAIENLRSVGA